MNDKTRRTAIITGATSGLGLRTAHELARDRSWHLVLTGRNPSRVPRGPRFEPQELDLGSLAAVRRFAERIRAGEGNRPPLRAIVCNAGTQIVTDTTTTTDGYETTFAVNHLGHFLLVELLLDALQPPARVIVVSSDTHDPQRRTGMPKPRYTTAVELADPDSDWAGEDSPTLAGRRRYVTSKLCNVLFTYELDRRIRRVDLNVTANAFDPGLMPGTGLARDYGVIQRFVWRFLLPGVALVAPNVHSPRSSARALARLVADEELEGASGRYFQGREMVGSSADSYDERIAADLWRTSAALAALST